MTNQIKTFSELTQQIQSYTELRDLTQKAISQLPYCDIGYQIALNNINSALVDLYAELVYSVAA